MISTFEQLFRKATGIATPHEYQRRLAADSWPDVLVAPTGFGKTAAVIMSWLYKRLVGAPDAPRRLVFCLPMRSLVEQTERSAKRWCAAVADEFRRTGVSVPAVHVLLGGRTDQDWRLDPGSSAVLVGTQDMLLSRALMRGYGMSRFQWAIDFALLHNDASWVFDEVQLMEAGLPTSAQLEAFRRDEARFKGTAYPCRSLWTSATLDLAWLKSVDFAPHADAAKVVHVTGESEPAARHLWEAAKKLTRAPFVLSKGSEKKGYATAVAGAALDARLPGKTVLVIVNRVDRAQAIYAELEKRAAREPSMDLLLIHSRFRRSEREVQTRRLNESPPAGGRIVVSTQAIEAGVDITSGILLTELAPWSSLVQRFGRCNRGGEEDAARVIWIDAEDDSDLARPYDSKVLKAARERLSSLADVGLRSLAGFPAGDLVPREVIRAKDFADLFDSDSDLSGFDVDVSRYIRSADDTDVQVFWRDLASEPDVAAIEPASIELCSVSFGRARAWLSAVQKATGRKLAFRVDPLARGGRNDTAWRPVDPRRIFAGQMLLIDVSAGGYERNLGFTGDQRHRPEIHRSDNGRGADTIEREQLSERMKCYIGLRQHLTRVADEAKKICAELDLEPLLLQSIVTAAAWHDVGKAHDEFQRRMGRDELPALLKDGAFLAKTKAYRRQTDRPYFRHELASALAWIGNDQAAARTDYDLVAYLIAAHHGKVRLNLRALPGEALPDDATVRFARGVWDGDRLPTVDVPGWGRVPEVTLSVGRMQIGLGSDGAPSWTECTRRLLRQHGPFRLAFLEALVCIADWRASKAEETEGNDDI